MQTQQHFLLKLKTLILLFASCFWYSSLFAQQSKKQVMLKTLSADFTTSYKKNYEKAVQYAKKNGLPHIIDRLEGSLYLQGITDQNELIYIKGFNRYAAETTGAAALNPGGQLGLGLSGEGMTVGVWEVGDPLLNHNELTGRAFKMDSPSSRRNAHEQNHATHVTGTIIAAGSNIEAQGMAYKAKSHNYSIQNDLAEMANAAENNLLISNHSYGSVRGWDGNEWFGNKSVSTQEDYLFGFYASQSANLDAIAYAATDYLIVWAAGNDRTDAPSSASADPEVVSTQDGPYDCIGPSGIAKNILTVGAIESISEYTGASSVVMSDFSSWGPADDGRIKPDLVGVGVDVFSSASGEPKSNPDDGVNENPNYYMTTSGTSMAAPNVAGTLLLLQELYQDLNEGQNMKSATLKALAIHTCREAGSNEGPDYQHGWGVMNAEGAANVLLQNTAQNGHHVIEDTLNNQSSYTMQVTSDGQNPIIATVVWTDPVGPIASASVDPSLKALVNDLDLRITGPNNHTFYPWKLNPATPTASATNIEDNNTDNVEKIEIPNPTAGTYTLTITHKGNLVDNAQAFGLVVSTAPVESTARTFYWVGYENENWNDGGNWALESGGNPADEVPTASDRVVFDDDHFILDEVILDSEVSISTLTFNNSENFTFNTNSFDLNIDGALLAYGAVTFEGNLNLTSELIPQNNIIIASEADFSNANLTFHTNDATKGWKVKSDLHCNNITISTGIFQLRDYTLNANQINLTSNAKISTHGDGTLMVGSSIHADFDGFEFQGAILTEGNISINLPNALFRTLDFSHAVTISSAFTLDSLLANSGSLNFSTPLTLNIEECMALRGSENKLISLNSNGGNSTLSSSVDSRFCNDFLAINNIQISGTTLFVTGDSSTIDQNSTGWTVDDCDNMLYANFNVFFACENSLLFLEDKSTGNPETWAWEIRQNETSIANITEQSPQLLFEGNGNIEIILRITRGEDSTTKSKTIELSPNTLSKPRIVVSGNILRIQAQPNATYQWIYNDTIVQDSNLNYYVNEALEEGVYQVLISDGNCRIASDEFNLSFTSAVQAENNPFKVYPNPAQNSLTIENFSKKSGEITIYNVLGQLVEKIPLGKERLIHLSEISWGKGLYILVWNDGEKMYRLKIQKE